MSIWRRKYDRIQVGRKQYRIEFNWNAYCEFAAFHNLTMDDLSDSNKISPDQTITYIYEAIKEGCRMENKKFPYSREDLAAMLSPETLDQLTIVIRSQNSYFQKSV